jgi:hypothetical protein
MALASAANRGRTKREKSKRRGVKREVKYHIDSYKFGVAASVA